MRRAIDSAICAVTRIVRNRAAARAPDGWPAWALIAQTIFGPGGVPCGKQSEEQSGRDRHRRREEDRRWAEARIATTPRRQPAAARRSSRASSAPRPDPRSPPSTASTHDSVRSWARSCRRVAPSDSCTAIWVARPAPRATQQVRDVRAGDEQHEPRNRRTAEATASSPLRGRWRAAASRLDDERPGLLEAGHRLIAHAFLERGVDVVDDGRVHAVHRRRGPGRPRRLGLSRANSRPPELLRLSKPFQPGTIKLAHRDRARRPRVHAERRAVEPAWGDANNRQPLAVDDQRLIEDRQDWSQAASSSRHGSAP